MRGRLREFLDDRDPAIVNYKQGVFWSDTELDRALTEAQWAVYAFLVRKRQSYLLQELVASVSGTASVALPANYAFSMSAEIEVPSGARSRPAALNIGWSNRSFIFSDSRYLAAVVGPNVEFWRNGVNAGVNGTLFYYTEPTLFGAATNHTEFDDRVYNAILWLAAALLQMKDSSHPSVTKFLNKYLDAVTKLFDEENEQYPQYLSGEYNP